MDSVCTQSAPEQYIVSTLLRVITQACSCFTRWMKGAGGSLEALRLAAVGSPKLRQGVKPGWAPLIVL